MHAWCTVYTYIYCFIISLSLALLPPKFPVAPYIIDGPDDITVHVGEDAQFNCVATSEPPHTVLWLFTNPVTGAFEELPNDEKYIIVNEDATSRLTVVDVVPSDDGEYTCDVVNVYGNDTSSAILTVICKSCDVMSCDVM